MTWLPRLALTLATACMLVTTVKGGKREKDTLTLMMDELKDKITGGWAGRPLG